MLYVSQVIIFLSIGLTSYLLNTYTNIIKFYKLCLNKAIA